MKRKCFSCKQPAKRVAGNGKAHCGKPECAMELYRIIKRQKDKKEKQIKERHKKVKAESVSEQHRLTQPVFNKMRRLECLLWFKENRREPECISCGKTNMDWCCGHYKTVGQTGTLRYDRKNTHLQCNAYCNRGLSGNIAGNKNTRGYTEGLYEVYGADTAGDILAYLETEQHKVKRWTGQELIELRKECNKRIRELEELL